MRRFCLKLPFVAMLFLLWCCSKTAEEPFYNSDSGCEEYAEQAITRAQTDTTQNSNGALSLLLQKLNNDLAANIRFLQAFRGKIPLLSLTRLSDSPDYGKAIYVPYSLPLSVNRVDGMVVIPVDQDKGIYERLFSGSLGTPVIIDCEVVEVVPMSRRYLYSKFFSQCRAVWIGTVNERLTDFADQIDNSPDGFIAVPKESYEQRTMTRSDYQSGIRYTFDCMIISGGFDNGASILIETTNTEGVVGRINQYLSNEACSYNFTYNITVLGYGRFQVDVMGAPMYLNFGNNICNYVLSYYANYSFRLIMTYSTSSLDDYYYGGGSWGGDDSGVGGGGSSSGGGDDANQPPDNGTTTDYIVVPCSDLANNRANPLLNMKIHPTASGNLNNGDYLGRGGGHKGIDLGENGDPVFAMFDGTIKRICKQYPADLLWDQYVDQGDSAKTGNRVEYECIVNGKKIYIQCWHLSSVEYDLVVGQDVTAGTVLGYVGQTGNASSGGSGGPHLHLQIKSNNSTGQILNPHNYIYSKYSYNSNRTLSNNGIPNNPC